ncbi:MAG: NAD(P)H-dependent oxidoreductase [Planctomycetota bacterium]
MTHVQPSTILQQLGWRYATKVFDPSRKISDGDWAALEQSLVLAPSSYGLQPWKFIVVTSDEVKEKLPSAAWNQPQPRDCSHFVIIAARRSMDAAYIDSFVEMIAAQRGVAVAMLDGYKQMMVDKANRNPAGNFEWNVRQCYIALGMLLETAAMLGIDACPMEGIVPDAIDELVGLKGTDYRAVVACALGYRAADDQYASLAKVRFSPVDVIRYL